MSAQKKRSQKTKQNTSPFASVLAFPARVAGWVSASFIGRFFHAYPQSGEMMEKSRTGSRLKERRLLRPEGRFRHLIGDLFTHSPLSAIVSWIGNVLRHTETRVYGIALVSFGFYSILSFVVRYFAPWARVADKSVLIIGILLVLISLPLLFMSRPLYIAMQESRLFSIFFYRLVGLPQYPYTKEKGRTIHPTIAFLFGSVAGILGFFVHPLYLVAGFLAVILFLLLLFSPELCLYVCLFFCPLFFFFEHPALLLTVVLLTGGIGYLFKVLLGKRIFSFKPLDLTVLLLFLLYVFSALFTRGGIPSAVEAVLYASLLIGYFLAANLLTTPAAISRAIRSLVSGGVLTAVFGLLQFLTGKAIAGWLDNSAYAYISGRINVAFENPNVLATYLILIFPFITAGILKKGQVRGRMASLFAFFVFMTAIILTQSRGAWIGVILSLAVFLFAYNPATVYVLLPAAAGGFATLQYFDSAIAKRLSSILELTGDSSISYRISIWHGSLPMAGDHLFSGIGVGEHAFHAVYPFYAQSGIESASHAHNLALQYLCEFGIIGPILLLLFTVIFFQCILTHQHEETNPNLRLYSMAAGGGILAVLVFGLTDHVFYNARIFFLFFAVAGIAAALSRVGHVERKRNTPIRDTVAEAYTMEIDINET